jgi:hypothetical protein
MTSDAASEFRAVVAEWPSDGGSASFWLGYHIGSEFYGETDARFTANGSYHLWSTVTAGGERREFSGRCDPNDVRRLASLIEREQLWGARHLRSTRADDDALVSIEVGDGLRNGRIELWVSELGLVPAFERVQEAILELVRRLSNNAILEVGR